MEPRGVEGGKEGKEGEGRPSRSTTPEKDLVDKPRSFAHLENQMEKKGKKGGREKVGNNAKVNKQA